MKNKNKILEHNINIEIEIQNFCKCTELFNEYIKIKKNYEKIINKKFNCNLIESDKYFF